MLRVLHLRHSARRDEHSHGSLSMPQTAQMFLDGHSHWPDSLPRPDEARTAARRITRLSSTDAESSEPRVAPASGIRFVRQHEASSLGHDELCDFGVAGARSNGRKARAQPDIA